MKSVRLRIEHTEETIHPMHRFVCESPAIEREVLLEGRTDDGVRTLLFYVEGSMEAYESVLEAQDEIIEYDLRPEGEAGFFLYVRAPNHDREALLVDTLDRETVVIVPPTEFRPDMTMVVTLVGHSDDLVSIVDSVPETLDVEVLDVGSYDRAVTTPLTDRQREAVEAAREVGYYEVPRTGDIETVARELDCAVSTASTLLRRAESRLVERTLEAFW